MDDNTSFVRVSSSVAVSVIAVIGLIVAGVTISSARAYDRDTKLGTACLVTGGEWRVNGNGYFECQK
jgi:hypothetical protein